MSDPTTTPTSGPPAAVRVRLPGPLRALAGAAEEPVEAATVGEALDRVLNAHPSLRRHLRKEDGALREHVNVFVNDEDVRWLDGEGTRLGDGDVITVVPSIAGG